MKKKEKKHNWFWLHFWMPFLLIFLGMLMMATSAGFKRDNVWVIMVSLIVSLVLSIMISWKVTRMIKSATGWWKR